MYAYPDHFTDELIYTMANEEKICHYVDIPFQHADNDILKAMNRHMTQEEMIDLVTKLRRAIPDIMIRSTFITGFPVETEEQFANLLDFLKQMRLERVGVFPYSQEDHTPAGIRKDQIPEEIREKRAAELMDVQYQIMYNCHLSRINSVCEVVVEEISKDIDGLLLCRSQGEAPDIDPFVLVYDAPYVPGDHLFVRISGVDEYDLIGEVVHESA